MRIVVVGCGGGGTNAVNNMIAHGIPGVEFMAVNTDAQHLFNTSKAEIKMQIGAKLTGGDGAGGDPAIGEKAAMEDYEMIKKNIAGSKMVFLTAGMGGGTGTGSIPVVGKIAKDSGALTIAIVTKPFNYEGRHRMRLAEEGIEKLKQVVDTYIIIPYENIFKLIDGTQNSDDIDLVVDGVLRQAVQAISDLVVKTGKINTDFSDVRVRMKDQGLAIMGSGICSGKNRATEAAKKAIGNSLLENASVEGAKKMLVNITSSKEISQLEIKEAMDFIRANADPDVDLKHGVFYEADMGDNVKITVIATGFNSTAKVTSEVVEVNRRQDGDTIPMNYFEQLMSGSSEARNQEDLMEVPAAARKPYNDTPRQLGFKY